jgi:hypothetical protein
MRKYIYFIFITWLFSSCTDFFVQSRENIVRTGELRSVEVTSAQVEGLLFDVGDSPEKKLITHGHVWATHEEPTVDDFKTSFGERTTFGEYVSYLSDLTEETKYYVRAYTQNEEGITYGQTLAFIPGLVHTLYISNIAKTPNNRAFASVAGSISLNIIPEKAGFCWAMNSSPTTGDFTKEIDLAMVQEGSIFALIENLETNKRYYIRAFVVYDGGKVTYGETFTFETPK